VIKLLLTKCAYDSFVVLNTLKLKQNKNKWISTPPNRHNIMVCRIRRKMWIFLVTWVWCHIYDGKWGWWIFLVTWVWCHIYDKSNYTLLPLLLSCISSKSEITHKSFFIFQIENYILIYPIFLCAVSLPMSISWDFSLYSSILWDFLSPSVSAGVASLLFVVWRAPLKKYYESLYLKRTRAHILFIYYYY